MALSGQLNQTGPWWIAHMVVSHPESELRPRRFFWPLGSQI